MRPRNHPTLLATALSLTVLGLTLGAPPARAAEGWSLRLAPAHVDTGARWARELPGGGRTTANLDGASGLAGSLAWRLTPHWGLAAGVLHSRLPITLTIEVAGSRQTSDDRLELTAPFAAVSWHPLPAGRLSPYLALGAAATRWGDLQFFSGQRVRSDDAFGWLVEAGVDLPLGPRTAFFAAAMRLDTSYDGHLADDPAKISLASALTAVRLGLAIQLGKPN